LFFIFIYATINKNRYFFIEHKSFPGEIHLNHQNICKFITHKNEDILTTHNFIYESNLPFNGIPQTHPHHILYLVRNGEGTLKMGMTTSLLKTGVLFFSFAGIPFTIENTDNLRYMYISFSGQRADELLTRFGISSSLFTFDGFEGLLPLWCDNIVRANDENIDLLSESLLLYTFSSLKKAKQLHSDPALDVLRYLEEHFTNSTLSLSSVAAELGYNAKYLSHLFKKHMGMGFSEYLKNMRIKHAILLMENGVTAVKNVALLCGFSDPLYFSRVFSEMIGVSPRQYLSQKHPTTLLPMEKSDFL